jgi:ABC-2 type transport system permease protein
MLPRWRRILVVARLEGADSLRSRWLQFTTAIYALVFGSFIWLGLRESSVLGFTGLSRVVLHMANAAVLAVPLVALVATCQAVTKARASGHLELLLVAPLRRSDWFAGLVLARAAVLVAPLAAMLAVAALAGSLLDPLDQALVPMTVHALLVSVTLLWAYLGIGLWISSVAKTLERAVVLALLVWLASAALHDFALIGLLLQWRMPTPVVFGLAALNPVEAARLAVLAAVDPDLSLLGPVGFWIANQLGPQWTYGLGLGWPAVVGTVAVLLAGRRVAKRDAVA